MFHPNIYKDGRICLDSNNFDNDSIAKPMESSVWRVGNIDLSEIVAIRPQSIIASQ